MNKLRLSDDGELTTHADYDKVELEYSTNCTTFNIEMTPEAADKLADMLKAAAKSAREDSHGN